MTIYANVVNVRSAGNDVVLEFGSFFPVGDQQFPSKDARPEIRVVIPSEVLAPLVEILRERLLQGSREVLGSAGTAIREFAGRLPFTPVFPSAPESSPTVSPLVSVHARGTRSAPTGTLRRASLDAIRRKTVSYM